MSGRRVGGLEVLFEQPQGADALRVGGVLELVDGTLAELLLDQCPVSFRGAVHRQIPGSSRTVRDPLLGEEELGDAVAVEEQFRCHRPAEEHVVVQIQEMFAQARNAVQLRLDGM